MSASAQEATVSLIPLPVSVELSDGTFTLTADTTIHVEADNAEIASIGQYLADKLNPATGFTIPVVPTSDAPTSGNIYLTTVDGDAALGDEGYELTVTADFVTLNAYKPEGLFRGLQTLRQLFPPAIDYSTVQSAEWTIPTGTIRDYPRFAWRGAMLDVSRHFFEVEDVKQYIDWLAYYKINRFHLHLADDQGWRIMINSWSNLARHGGSTEVGGGDGGFFTQEDYADIVAYAQERYLMIIPEIDMPGHTNAALASYPELNCDDVAPDLYTGTEVGFSSLCVDKEITYAFVEDVIRELAALTPGPYIHIGGDEALATKGPDYIRFIERVESIVEAHGKHVIGWEEIAQIEMLPTTVAQHWNSSRAREAVQQGSQVIMSPASRAYLDMKYDSDSPLGLNWAGYITVETGYNWDPATQVEGVGEENILGVEAPLWSETLETLDDIAFMAFPRLPGYAEIGWSQQEGRNWEEYQSRLAAHGARFTALEINFYASPEIEWQE